MLLKNISRNSVITLTLLFLVFLFGLSGIYHLSTIFFRGDFRSLLGVALVNLLLGLLFLFLKRKKILDIQPALGTKAMGIKNKLSFIYKSPYLIGLLYALFIFVLATISSFFGDKPIEKAAFDPIFFILTVFFIPIVEEFAFRGFLTSLFFKVSNSNWAPYFSVILFSALHTVNSPYDVLTLNVGFAFGPLLLGVFCEMMMAVGLGLSACVAFHIAANATLFIFRFVDPRWLDWLSVFYLGV